MTEKALKIDISKIDHQNQEHVDRRLTSTVRRLMNSYGHDDHFRNTDSPPMPDVESVAEVMERARRIIFPGYFSGKRVDSMDLGHYIEQETRQLFRDLANLIALSTGQLHSRLVLREMNHMLNTPFSKCCCTNNKRPFKVLKTT